jgi:hypothetical protein
MNYEKPFKSFKSNNYLEEKIKGAKLDLDSIQVWNNRENLQNLNVCGENKLILEEKAIKKAINNPSDFIKELDSYLNKEICPAPKEEEQEIIYANYNPKMYRISQKLLCAKNY